MKREQARGLRALLRAQRASFAGRSLGKKPLTSRAHALRLPRKKSRHVTSRKLRLAGGQFHETVGSNEARKIA